MAILLCQLGFDGVDINMGCPTRSVAHSGAGAALIKTPELAQEIVRAVKTGIYEWYNGATVRDCADTPAFIKRLVEQRAAELPPEVRRRRLIPVSIKTRVGYDVPEVESWIPRLLETGACRHCYSRAHPAPGLWWSGRLGQDRPAPLPSPGARVWRSWATATSSPGKRPSSGLLSAAWTAC